jgi:hypothetical protein
MLSETGLHVCGREKDAVNVTIHYSTWHPRTEAYQYQRAAVYLVVARQLTAETNAPDIHWKRLDSIQHT